MPVVLTSDICAHGVIASARYLGYDPVAAVLATRGPLRAVVTAAALAAEELTGARRDTIARIFGLRPTSLARCVRENTKAHDRARAAAARAMIAAGIDRSGGGLISEQPVDRTPLRTRPAPPSSPAPAASSATAPAPRVDHTAAIRAVMAKMSAVSISPAARTAIAQTLAGADAALVGAATPRTCCWPLGDLRLGTLRYCGAETVSGRNYCPEHCRAAGQKTTPKPIAVVGRVAEPYRDPRADNASARKAAC